MKDTGTRATMPRHHWKHAVQVGAAAAGVKQAAFDAIALEQVPAGSDRLTLWYLAGECVSDAIAMAVDMARGRELAIKSWDSRETLRKAMGRAP